MAAQKTKRHLPWQTSCLGFEQLNHSLHLVPCQGSAGRLVCDYFYCAGVIKDSGAAAPSWLSRFLFGKPVEPGATLHPAATEASGQRARNLIGPGIQIDFPWCSLRVMSMSAYTVCKAAPEVPKALSRQGHARGGASDRSISK